MSIGNSNLNQIFFGPSGTGKTNKAIIESIKIIEPKIYDDYLNNKIDYKKVKEKFDELRFKGRIEFITFHEGYTYEEFVEGISIIPSENHFIEISQKFPKYPIKNGIFKKISDKALFSLIDVPEKEKNAEKEFYVRLNVLEKKYPVGSLIKTQNQSKFEIVSYEENAINIQPCNSINIYPVCFEHLITLMKSESKITSKKDVENIINDDFGLSNYYLGIYQVLMSNPIDKKDYNIDYELNVNEYIKKFYNNKYKIKNDNKTDKYVLIIDEINRGDISKVFGELITLIEEDKRIGTDNNIVVTLPYSKQLFGVPKNLYIIGTMNIAEGKTASIDTSLIPRFNLVEMMPKMELIKDETVRHIVGVLNKRITSLSDRNHQIGQGYFVNSTLETLKNEWYSIVIPLLVKYFGHDWIKLQALLGEARNDNLSFIKKDENIDFAVYCSSDKNIYFDFNQKDNFDNNKDFIAALKNAKLC